MRFDRSKIPEREWRYQDDDLAWAQGIALHPDKGVLFWAERLDGEQGAAYRMSFHEFFCTKDFGSAPPEIIEEIRQILRAAQSR